MKRWKLAVGVAGLIAVGAWWWSGRGGGAAAADDAGWLEAAHDDEPSELLLDRAWFDHMPKEPTEFAEVVILQDDDQRFGVFLRGSAWRLDLEVMKYRAGSRAVRMRFPQTGKRAEVRYRIEECDELPPYDLCLTIDKNPWGKAKRFYAERDCDDADDLADDEVCRRQADLAGRAAAATPR